MAVKNSMPERAIAQTENAVFEGDNEIREPVHKKDARRLHGKRTDAASMHPGAETPQDSSACCELYSRMDKNYLPLNGKWLSNAGFIDGIPVKIRVMKDCIVITAQHTRELWGCLEGMSVVNMNKQKVANWLKMFPGALNDTGDVPVDKRGSGHCV